MATVRVDGEFKRIAVEMFACEAWSCRDILLVETHAFVVLQARRGTVQA